ncbi:MAG: hypothetical protein H7345_20305, partial [Rubritepida sp.]|nr:hypothetical protein [Rubritepida sp.]
ETPEERRAFLRRHGDAPTLVPARPSNAFTLQETARAGAATALAHVVGPIARLLVQKAEAGAADAHGFIDALCAHATAQEAPGLRRRLEGLF